MWWGWAGQKGDGDWHTVLVPVQCVICCWPEPSTGLPLWWPVIPLSLWGQGDRNYVSSAFLLPSWPGWRPQAPGAHPLWCPADSSSRFFWNSICLSLQSIWPVILSIIHTGRGLAKYFPWVGVPWITNSPFQWTCGRWRGICTLSLPRLILQDEAKGLCNLGIPWLWSVLSDFRILRELQKCRCWGHLSGSHSPGLGGEGGTYNSNKLSIWFWYWWSEQHCAGEINTECDHLLKKQKHVLTRICPHG